jgi:hypothetical protein
MHQLDVKKTLLNNFLNENIYMFMLEGLPIPPNPQIICKILKFLYGLKQFSRAWCQCLENYLIFQGFPRLESNVNIYIKKLNVGFVVLIVYVDDCIFISNIITLIEQIKFILQQEFNMSNDGELHYALSNAILYNQQEG